MEEKIKEIKNTPVKTQSLTICLLVFSVIVTVVTLVGFFAATFNRDNISAFNIANIYILFMILAVPTLTLFLDKPDCRLCKTLNKIGIALVFTAILVIVVTSIVVQGFGL